jgi:hypothetical protein
MRIRLEKILPAKPASMMRPVPAMLLSTAGIALYSMNMPRHSRLMTIRPLTRGLKADWRVIEI